MKLHLVCKQICNRFAVTQEVPDQPVISPLSGAIFERRVVEKYITENGCDPITGAELKIEQLIEIKSKSHLGVFIFRKN